MVGFLECHMSLSDCETSPQPFLWFHNTQIQPDRSHQNVENLRSNIQGWNLGTIIQLQHQMKIAWWNSMKFLMHSQLLPGNTSHFSWVEWCLACRWCQPWWQPGGPVEPELRVKFVICDDPCLSIKMKSTREQHIQNNPNLWLYFSIIMVSYFGNGT